MRKKVSAKAASNQIKVNLDGSRFKFLERGLLIWTWTLLSNTVEYAQHLNPNNPLGVLSQTSRTPVIRCALWPRQSMHGLQYLQDEPKDVADIHIPGSRVPDHETGQRNQKSTGRSKNVAGWCDDYVDETCEWDNVVSKVVDAFA